MKRVFFCVVAWMVAFLFLGTASAQAPKAPAASPEPPGKQAARKPESDLWGRWRAASIDGRRQKFLEVESTRVRLVISEKKLVVRVGRQVIVESSCTLDLKQNPPTIDLQFQGGRLLGIYQLEGGELRICLADAESGRPKRLATAGDGAGEILLVLRRDSDESPLYVVDADGKNLRRLPAADDFSACGSPDWSHDGKLAFDAWEASVGETYGAAHIFTVSGCGTGLRDLGLGAMPSWSPDGKRLAFSHYQPRGVFVMNADGSDRKLIDEQGWGVEWSPKAEEVAYIVYENGANLCVRDLAKGTQRTLLDTQYRSIYWGFSWSADGQWLCFKGITPDGKEQLVAVHRQGEAKGHKIVLAKSEQVRYLFEGMSWRGEGQPIVDALILSHNDHCQLYLVDPDGKTPPRLLPGQDPARSNESIAWSRDGKRIAYTSRQIPRPPKPKP